MTFLNRARFSVTVAGIVWLLLVTRLFQIQFWQMDQFAERAVRQRDFSEEIIPRPGDVFDRQDRLIATTITMRSLYLVPSQISKPWSVAQTLAETLGIESDPLFEKIGGRDDRHFLWVKRRLNSKKLNCSTYHTEHGGFETNIGVSIRRGSSRHTFSGFETLTAWGGAESKRDSITFSVGVSVAGCSLATPEDV